MSDIEIRKSRIHGKGVFASRDFRKGEAVIRWKTSKILTAAQVNKLPAKEKKYVSCFSKGKYILHGKPERYVNHSCEPNIRASKEYDIALRNISKGEEITADYSMEGILKGMKCNCSSPRCEGVIGRKQ